LCACEYFSKEQSNFCFKTYLKLTEKRIGRREQKYQKAQSAADGQQLLKQNLKLCFHNSKADTLEVFLECAEEFRILVGVNVADGELNSIPQSGRRQRAPNPDDQIVLLRLVIYVLQNSR
jgi:hypothetical protein